MSEHFSINVPEYDGEPKRALRLWWLKKGRKEVTCDVWTHPIGAELRVEVDGEFVRTEASRDTLALVDRSIEFEKQFREKGWTR